jgi:sugar lactone lactonase YvrE
MPALLRRSPCLALATLAALAGAAASAAGADDCRPRGDATPLCGFRSPEDLAPLPGGKAIVVAEFGGMHDATAGALSLLDLASETRRVLFRGGDAKGAATAGWGDPSCPGPPGAGFSPHGIDLAARPDGRLALAVVQHGGRESIELFEALGSGREWKLAWRGCLVAPEDAWLNDVVWLPDGSLIASHMASRAGGAQKIQDGEAGPGHALHWSAREGFRALAGTRGALPNGVEVSPDGTKLFLNVYSANEVRRIDLATGTIEARAAVLSPDNSTWAPDGTLLVASLRPTGGMDFSRCQDTAGGPCPIGFAIVAVDPESMRTRELYRGDGVTMGAGTVGLRVGRDLFVGSFAGDRVLRVRLDE